MKAITYQSFGGVDRLELGEVPDPHVGPDSVLVEVVAASLNPVDYKVREGYLEGGIDTLLPAIPGWDVAGVVVQAGFDTPGFEVGDEVIAYARKDVVSGGTLAELVEVPVRTAAHKPAELSFEAGAALPLAGLTALQTIRRSGLGQGARVLIHAASGGVGSFATQLAVRAGGHVVGTSSATNHEYVRSLGAIPVPYGHALVARALEASPNGFDVVLDYAGGDALDTVPDLLAPGGTVVSVADPRARDEYAGQYVWVRPDSHELRELALLAASGELAVEIAGTYGLDRAAEAFRALESGHIRGKIVIRVSD